MQMLDISVHLLILQLRTPSLAPTKYILIIFIHRCPGGVSWKLKHARPSERLTLNAEIIFKSRRLATFSRARKLAAGNFTESLT